MSVGVIGVFFCFALGYMTTEVSAAPCPVVCSCKVVSSWRRAFDVVGAFAVGTIAPIPDSEIESVRRFISADLNVKPWPFLRVGHGDEERDDLSA